MGGCLTVSSKEHYGSTFTFILPYKVSCTPDDSDDSDDISDLVDHEDTSSSNDITAGYFKFVPRISSSFYASGRTKRNQNLRWPETDSFTEESFPSPCRNESTASSVIFSDTNSNREQPSNGAMDQNDASDIPFPINDMDYWNGDGNKGIISSQAAFQKSDQKVKVSKSLENGSNPLHPRILLVEDNKVNIMVAQSMMKQLGYSIEIVNNGADAIRAVQRDRYDLVLMVSFKTTKYKHC